MLTTETKTTVYNQFFFLLSLLLVAMLCSWGLSSMVARSKKALSCVSDSLRDAGFAAGDLCSLHALPCAHPTILRVRLGEEAKLDELKYGEEI